MSQFKAMKFWIGEDENRLQGIIHDLLKGLGYVCGYDYRDFNERIIFTEYKQGVWRINGNTSQEKFDTIKAEEINIDWMRTPKKETIELNGKKYLKEDLEEALKHLKPVG